MVYKKIGPIEIMGEADSRVPFSTSLIIKGKNDSTLIDCGSGKTTFDYLKKEHHLKKIYLTHHHMDHTWGIGLFPEAEKFINKYDIDRVSDLIEIAKTEGNYAVMTDEELAEWIEEREKQTFGGLVVRPRTLNVAETYNYNEKIELSGVDVTFIHAPGHTEGFCIPYIEKYGILHVGDIDLTSFGPYYGDADSDIDQFIVSAKKTLELDAAYYVTSHHKGVISRENYKQELDKYLSIIDRREEKIIQAIQTGCSPKELMEQEIVFFQSQSASSPVRRKSEAMIIIKHLQRLIKNGEPYADFYELFMQENNIKKAYVDYPFESVDV